MSVANHKRRTAKQSCSGKAFTLIELLVVVAIIAMLMGLLMPVLRKARSQARMAYCASHLHQIGLAIATYQAETGKGKLWETERGSGQTADFSHEYCGGQTKVGRGAINRYLVDRHQILPDRKAFFCPSVANLSYKKNYTWPEATRQVGPDEAALSQSCAWCRANDFPQKHFRFWSTYTWIWPKRVIANGLIQQVNKASSKVLMFDDSPSQWRKTARLTYMGPNFASFDVHQSLEHYNALMYDGHVERPAMDDRTMNMWLWGRENWPGETVLR